MKNFNENEEKLSEEIKHEEKQVEEIERLAREEREKLKELEHELEELKHDEDHEKPITIVIDSEPYKVKQREMTADEILLLVKEIKEGKLKDWFLVLLKDDGGEVSYRDKGNEQIKLHNGMRFTANKIGPAGVS